MEKNEVMLVDVRIAWPKLFKAEAFQGGKPRFTATFILEDKKHAKELAACEAIIADIVEKDYAGERPGEKEMFLRRGDDAKKKKNKDGSWKAGFGPGTKYISASSNQEFPPRVIDTKANEKKPIASDDPRLFSGCRVNAIISIKNIKAYDRVCAFIQIVQYHRTDTPIAGGVDDSVLDEIPDPPEPAMAGDLDDL